MSKSSTDTVASVPHSWDCHSWPPTVFPCSSDRARWIVRSYRSELVANGALSRMGKTLVILGKGYARWLDSRVAQVGEFQSNNPRLGSKTAADQAAAA